MTGWEQTLDGTDVCVNGDGWVWYPRQQGWYWEPNLLTMPVPPMAVQMRSEIDRLTTDWPTLREAWKWTGPNSGGFFRAIGRLYILGFLAFFVGRIPALYALVKDWGHPPFPDNEFGALIYVFFSGLVALLFGFTIYLSHTWDRDPHKGFALAAGFLAVTAERRHRREGSAQ